MNGPEQESRYRNLFEGSQASLSDMSARHAQALGRVGRLRNAIVTVLRRNFMELSAQAEANLGRRLSEVDDEILVAYLEAFVADASRGDQRATLQAMAEAVASLGVPLRGDEPLLWVEQIHAHRNELAKNRTAPAASRSGAATPVTPAPAKERENAWGGERPDVTPTPKSVPVPAAVAADAEDYWGWEPAVTLSDLFKDDLDQENDTYDDALHDVRPDDVQPDDVRQDNTQRDGTQRDVTAPVGGRAQKNAAGGGKRGDRAAKTPTPKTATPTTGARENVGSKSSPASDEQAPAGSTVTPGRAPKNQRRAKDDSDAGTGVISGDTDNNPGEHGGELLGELFKEMNLEGTATTQLWGDPLGDVTVEEERWTPSPIAPSAATTSGRVERTTPGGRDGRDATPATEPETVGREREPRSDRSSEPVDDTTKPVAARKPLITPAPGRDGTATTTQNEPNDVTAPEPVSTPPAPPAGATPATSIEAPFRPELFTAPAPGARRKRTRAVRVQAQAPEDGLPFVTAADAVLDDRMREALLAAASIPRPVFTRDLIAVAGDERIVDAWEAECRANVSTSPVRFVTPKSRHRQRGRLVAVDEGDPRPQDWWHQAVARYRAGRLYELGVLLHRVGDEIVSFELGEQAALFRLNTPRGLVGVVVALDLAVGDSSGTRGELAEIIGRLLTERLTLLAVLTASGENGSLESLVTTLEELSLENGWRPTSPIVAARSWEYADDRGSSAVMVLSQ